MKNITESQRTRKNIKARAKNCYYNAFRVVTTLRDYANATYVEGFAVLPSGLLIEHGWIERNGEIIDPTLVDEGISYFPGLRFNGEKGIAEVFAIPKPDYTKEDLPIFYRFGWGGSDSPEFSEASRKSWAFVMQFCEQRA